MAIKIDKGIPVSRSNGHARYPFAELEAGDSFLFPSHMKMSITGSRLDYWRKKFPDRKFVTRTTPEGVRCWRVT